MFPICLSLWSLFIIIIFLDLFRIEVGILSLCTRQLKPHTSLNLLMFAAAATAAKSLQSCPTLCDPIDGSPPGSPVPGILQARTLEWVAVSFSNA